MELRSFLVSNILFILTYFTVVSFYWFFGHYDRLSKIFKEILLFNGVLTLIAIPFFFLPKQYQEWFWYFNELKVDGEELPRLAMFTYEASYYSLLLTPILFYYLLKLAFNHFVGNKWLMLVLLGIPLLMSLSFGVLGTVMITILLLCLLNVKILFRYRRPFFMVLGVILLFVMVLVILKIYFPGNILFARIVKVLEGRDTSANGRIVDSFTMAWRIADVKNLWFGVGLGQIKVMAAEIIAKYYNYWGVLPRYDIPNAMGEMLAIFGLTGVLLKIGLEWWLFFKTKVSQNYYRLALFIFIFIYQFTGSFITNIAEYVIWGLAFSQVFPQFNIVQRKFFSGT